MTKSSQNSGSSRAKRTSRYDLLLLTISLAVYLQTAQAQTANYTGQCVNCIAQGLYYCSDNQCRNGDTVNNSTTL